jgi:RNA polymerase sigma-70 factor (ECF subfamily)
VSPGPSHAPDLARIFDEHFAYVWASLRRLGVREADLEDQAHEVFLKVHARLDQYDPERPIRPWLFAFAFRVAADYRRLARHRVEVLGRPHVEAVDPEGPADVRMQAAQDRDLLVAALETLELDRRAVLILHEVDEVPVPAVAHALGIPVGTAYSRLRLGRQDLAAALKRLRKQRGDP